MTLILILIPSLCFSLSLSLYREASVSFNSPTSLKIISAYHHFIATNQIYMNCLSKSRFRNNDRVEYTYYQNQINKNNSNVIKIKNLPVFKENLFLHFSKRSSREGPISSITTTL